MAPSEQFAALSEWRGTLAAKTRHVKPIVAACCRPVSARRRCSTTSPRPLSLLAHPPLRPAARPGRARAGRRASSRRSSTIAARTPDHGKLHPWRFVHVAAGPARRLRRLARRAPTGPTIPTPGRLEIEANERFAHQAPELIVAFSSPVEGHKIPVWEQELSCGAACMNLLLAAHALGFAGGWVTGWAAYSPSGARALRRAARADRRLHLPRHAGRRAGGAAAARSAGRWSSPEWRRPLRLQQIALDPASVLVHYHAYERRPPRLSPPARQYRRHDPRRPGPRRRSAALGAQPRRRLRRQSADRRQGLSDLPGGRAGDGEARRRHVRRAAARPSGCARPSARTSSRIAGPGSSRTCAGSASTPRIWSSARSPVIARLNARPPAVSSRSHRRTRQIARRALLPRNDLVRFTSFAPAMAPERKDLPMHPFRAFLFSHDLPASPCCSAATGSSTHAARARPAGRRRPDPAFRRPDRSALRPPVRLDLPRILAHHAVRALTEVGDAPVRLCWLVRSCCWPAARPRMTTWPGRHPLCLRRGGDARITYRDGGGSCVPRPRRCMTAGLCADAGARRIRPALRQHREGASVMIWSARGEEAICRRSRATPPPTPPRARSAARAGATAAARPRRAEEPAPSLIATVAHLPHPGARSAPGH